MNEAQHQRNEVYHRFCGNGASFKMLTVHYWYTGVKRGGARPDEIAFPLLSLTQSSMRRDQEFRCLSMPAFAKEEDLASHGPSPEGILPATKWQSPWPDMCVVDAMNIACGTVVVTKEDMLCVC